jgi:Protein of unknown function (DUF3618)
VTMERNDDMRLAEADADQADLREDIAATTSLSDDEATEAAEIRAEIEETRLEMGGTLNELGERLEPGHLVDQAKENVREATIGRVEETAKGVSDMVMETIKRNPIPAAMAGAGLALLWKNRSNTNGNGGSGQFRSGDYRAYGYDGQYGTQYGSQYGSQGQGQGIGQKVGDVAGTVGGTVGDAAGTVADTAGQAVGTVAQGAGQAVNEVSWRLDRFMQASPLAMGAIAIGAGAVAGSILPETPAEQQLLGDTSRQLASTVREGVDTVATKAEEQLDKTEQQVGATSGA